MGVGNSAPVVDYETVPAVAAALVVANMNSIPLDWAARFSVGGVNMNFFIVKQLPVLPPGAYLKDAGCGTKYVELIVPRVLELIYTGDELEGFAADLGYHECPFPWGRSAPPSASMRSRRDLRTDVPPGAGRSRMDPGFVQPRHLLPVAQTARNEAVR